MSDIRVLHVIVPEPPGEVGGPDIHLLELAEVQRRSGIDAAVFERGSGDFAALVAARGIPVTSATGAGVTAGLRLLRRAARDHRAHLIHSHGYNCDYWAFAGRAVAAELRGAPLVITQHGIVDDTLWHRAKTLLQFGCATRAEALVTASAPLGERMRRFRRHEAPDVIVNGIAPISLPASTAEGRWLLKDRHGVPEDGWLLGYVGRLAAEKRVDVVLRTFAALHRLEVATHLVLVGGGPERAGLEALARGLGLGPGDVTFTGVQDDVGSVYGALDTLLLLSDIETSPRVLIEALSCGVPAVASAVGGVPDLAAGRSDVRVVPRRDVAAAVDALLDLGATPRAHHPVCAPPAEWTIERMEAEIRAVYDRVLARGRARRRQP